jgi:hypothetical protein
MTPGEPAGCQKSAASADLGFYAAARPSLDGVLAPAGIDFFRRPYILALLLRDRDLQCWAGPSRVDGRFNWVNPKHAEFVWEGISGEGRLLPILLVDGSDEAGEQLARRAADELAGLAPVLAVDARSQRILEDRLADIDASIPRGGARLVWPDLALRHWAGGLPRSGRSSRRSGRPARRPNSICPPFTICLAAGLCGRLLDRLGAGSNLS